MALGPFVYVLPVHNEEALLARNVERARTYLERFPGSWVLAVENGSRDRSWAVAQELEARAQASGQTPVAAFREPEAGIGFAYHRGLTEALGRVGPSPSAWAILTGADLPFGFSDLEAALVHLGAPPGPGAPRVLMGSKAHPQSRIDNGPTRRLMTAAYRVARRLAVGMQVGDSQGSVFVRLDLAAELAPRIKARGFFYSTELCHVAERAGEVIVELPVAPDAALRPSTVSPVRDGLGMARELVRLRREDKRRGR
jgi:glycosyltransferase involved in cell wall biosynthesis